MGIFVPTRTHTHEIPGPSLRVRAPIPFFHGYGSCDSCRASSRHLTSPDSPPLLVPTTIATSPRTYHDTTGTFKFLSPHHICDSSQHQPSTHTTTTTFSSPPALMSLRPAKREPTNTNSDLARGKLANVCTEAL